MAGTDLGRLFLRKPVAQIYGWLTEHELWAQQNLELLGFLSGPLRRVVDLGCGTGVGTEAMARKLGSFTEVVGVEPADPMFRMARARARPGLRFESSDAAQLPLEAGSVDGIVGCSFLYMVADRPAVLREARRVLRPGARLAFMEPCEDGRLGAAARSSVGRFELVRGPAQLRLAACMVAWRVASGLQGRPRAVQLRAELVAAGFERIRFEPTLGGLGHHVVAEAGRGSRVEGGGRE